ncbi:MAG: methyltransferase domain-containing protein [Candidatus Omnitrophota bacterium]
MNKKHYYDSTIEAPPATMDTYYAEVSFRIILDKISKIGKNLDILDVGCGEGLLGSFLSKENKVYGVDIHKEKIERCIAKGIKAQLIAADAGLPYEDSKFDVVTCCQALEHIMDPSETVSEIMRVLKPRGYFIAAVPNMYDLRTRFLYPFGVRTKITYGSNLGHIRFFSKKTFAELIEDEGFEICINISSTFTRCVIKPIALACYIISFVRNPFNLKELKLRKQKCFNSFDLFLTRIFGFTGFGSDLFVLARKKICNSD